MKLYVYLLSFILIAVLLGGCGTEEQQQLTMPKRPLRSLSSAPRREILRKPGNGATVPSPLRRRISARIFICRPAHIPSTRRP